MNVCGLGGDGAEDSFRIFAELTYDWEYWIDAQGVAGYMSPSCRRITGYSPEEFVADPELLRRIVHDEDRPAWDAHAGRAPDTMRPGQVAELEFRIVTRDGAVRWIHQFSVPVTDAEGRLAGWRASNRDVTKHRNEADTIRIQALVLDQISDRVTVTDMDSRIAYVNRSQCRNLGFEPEDLIGKPVDSFGGGNPDLEAQQHEITRRTLEDGEWRGIVENLGRERSIQRIYLRTQVIRADDGRPVVMSGVGTDITELELAREAREESEATMRAAFAGMRDRVMVLDREGRYAGFSTESAAGGAAAGCPTDLRAGIAQALSEKRPVEVTYPLEQDGSTRWYATVVSPIGSERVVCVARDVTENRRADEELREREAKYRAAIETSADGFLALDPDGRILEVNEAYVRRSGFSHEQLLQMNVRDLEDADETGERAAWIARCVNSGSELCERWHRGRNGTPWRVELNVGYWRIGGGRLFVFVRDLLRRSRSEALLHTRFRLSEIAATTDLNGLMRAAVDEAERVTGSSIGFFHFVGPDQQTISLQTWSTNTLTHNCRAEGPGRHYPVSQAGVWVDCLRAGKPVAHNDYESLPHKRGLPEGHARVVRELTAPVIRDRAVVAILGVGNKGSDYDEADAETLSELASLAWDIVDRRRAQDALSESEARYRAVVASTSDGIILQATSGKILAFNAAAEKILEVPAREVLGETSTSRDWRLVHEDGSEWHGEDHPSMRTLATGESCRDLLMGIKRPDGTVTWIYNNTIPILAEEGGKPEAVVITFSDITARKQMEDDLRRSLADNEALLREVHHRVKNNLAAVAGLLDMQRRALGDAASALALEDLQHRLRSMALVHEKLYRAENAAAVDFDDYLRALTSHLRTSMHFRGELTCTVQAKTALSLDLAVPCGMIVSELVTNSLRHAFPGGKPASGEPACRVAVEMETGPEYRLSVTDNGTGIPPHVNPAETRSLGLRLVRMLAEHQLGGAMSVDRDRGTRVEVRFVPRRKERK